MAVMIYVDESGVHSNRYVVICALITRDARSRKRIHNLMKRKLVEYRKPTMQDEIHAHCLSLPQKQDILNLLAAPADYEVAYIVADKDHLVPELKKRHNLYYNYLFKILFEKLAPLINDDIYIIGDERDVAAGSKNSLPEYIKTEAYANWGFTHSLGISFMNSTQEKRLQAADVLANAIYAKYNLDKNHLYSIHKDHYIKKIQFPYRLFGS